MGWLHRTLARLRAWWRAAINRLFAGRITVDAAQLSRQQAEIARAIGESTLRVRELEASIRACRAACDAHEIQAIERIQEGDEQGATEALLRAERERERLEQLQAERPQAPARSRTNTGMTRSVFA